MIIVLDLRNSQIASVYCIPLQNICCVYTLELSPTHALNCYYHTHMNTLFILKYLNFHFAKQCHFEICCCHILCVKNYIVKWTYSAIKNEQLVIFIGISICGCKHQSLWQSLVDTKYYWSLQMLS